MSDLVHCGNPTPEGVTNLEDDKKPSTDTHRLAFSSFTGIVTTVASRDEAGDY